jgi:hypothetical protein
MKRDIMECKKEAGVVVIMSKEDLERLERGSKFEMFPVEEYFVFPKGSFSDCLKSLINKHSIENDSDTPDYILAEYLKQCLNTFGMCVRRRDKHYGFSTWPGDN